MEIDLQKQVVEALAKRKGEWKKIATDLKGAASYSLISQLGRGKYASEVAYSKIKLLHAHLVNPPGISG